MLRSDSREVDSVKEFSEGPLGAIRISEDNFLDELALDSSDFQLAFGVVDFADHDAFLSWKVEISCILSVFTLKVAVNPRDSSFEAEAVPAQSVSLAAEHPFARPLGLSDDDLHFFL